MKFSMVYPKGHKFEIRSCDCDNIQCILKADQKNVIRMAKFGCKASIPRSQIFVQWAEHNIVGPIYNLVTKATP